jgi:hypothetical protein
MVKRIFIFFIVGCFIIKATFATDTLNLKKPILLDKIGREYAPKYLLVEDKFFKIPYSPQNNGFFDNLSYSHERYSQVYFSNSKFDVIESSKHPTTSVLSSGFYIIDSCEITYLPIVNTTGNISISSSTLHVLSVENTNNLRLTLSDDSSISFVVMQNNKNIEFQLNQCSFKDSSEIRIFNSTLSQFDFSYNQNSSCNVFFQNDTLNFFGASVITDDTKLLNYKDWYKHENVFTFYKCHINSSFDFFERIPNSIFVFNNCSFGPDAYLGDMAIDNLVIKNCQVFPEQIGIGFHEKNNEVKLELENSNLDNIRFDFSPNIKLVFDSLDSKDAITNSYKNLLEKFEHEGKDRSYELVDLQYKKFKDSFIFHFVNSVWWYHGYNPGLVFLWTTLFLCVFFWFNKRYWLQMLETYPLKDDKKSSLYNQKSNRLRYYSIVLLYTCFIFFSLRVDLNKLNFKNLKFVYAFMLQYLIGLLCMIFIIRFIFKL